MPNSVVYDKVALISVAFLKKPLLVHLKKGASPIFRQASRASYQLYFLKFTSKLSHCNTVSHSIFAMASLSGGKFDLKL